MKWIFISVTCVVSILAIPVEKKTVETEPKSISEHQTYTDVKSVRPALVETAFSQLSHQDEDIKSLEKISQPIATNFKGLQSESSIILQKVKNLVEEESISNEKGELNLQSKDNTKRSHKIDDVDTDSNKQISKQTDPDRSNLNFVPDPQIVDDVDSQTKQASVQSIISQLNPSFDTTVQQLKLKTNQQADSSVKSLVDSSNQNDLIEKSEINIGLQDQKQDGINSSLVKQLSEAVGINVNVSKQNVNKQALIDESLENKEQVQSKTPEINVQLKKNVEPTNYKSEIKVNSNVKQQSESIVSLPIQESRQNVKQQTSFVKSLVEQEQLQTNRPKLNEQLEKGDDSANLKPEKKVTLNVKLPAESIASPLVQESTKNVQQQVDLLKSLKEKEQLQSNKSQFNEQHEKDVESTALNLEQKISTRTTTNNNNNQQQQQQTTNNQQPSKSIASLLVQESRQNVKQQVDFVNSLVEKEQLQSNKQEQGEQSEKDGDSINLKPEEKVTPIVKQPSESIGNLLVQDSGKNVLQQVDFIKSHIEKEQLQSHKPELKKQHENNVESAKLKLEQKVSSHVQKIPDSFASFADQESRFNVNADIEASSVKQEPIFDSDFKQIDTFSSKLGQMFTQSDDSKLDSIVLSLVEPKPKKSDIDVSLPSKELRLIGQEPNSNNLQSNRQVEATKKTNQVIHDIESLKMDGDFFKSTQNVLGTSVEQEQFQNTNSHYKLDGLVDINLLKHKAFQENGSKFSSSLDKKPIHIVHYVSNRQVEGGYEFRFETENGITRKEEGQLRQIVDDGNQTHKVVVVRGSYQYPKADGTFEKITYFADETGYHAEGDSIPKAIIVSRI